MSPAKSNRCFQTRFSGTRRCSTKPSNLSYSDHDNSQRTTSNWHWRPCRCRENNIDRNVGESVHPDYNIGITNDIYTQEDAEALMRMQILPQDRVIGVETGGCPHTAIGKMPINLAAVAEMKASSRRRGGPHRKRWRQPFCDLLARTGRLHDLRD